MATGRQGCPSRQPMVAVGASPAPPSALGAFMVEDITANQSYYWKHKGKRAEQCGHGSYPMEIVSEHLAKWQKHGQRENASDTVIAVRHQPIRGRIHRHDCYDRRRRPVCCFPHHSVLTVISPECTKGEASPEFVKLHQYSDTQAWDLALSA